MSIADRLPESLKKRLPRGIIYERGTKWWQIIFIIFNQMTAKIAPRFFVKRFHLVWGSSGAWLGVNWLGVQTLKPPTDLWMYQEIIWETKPQIFIETGSNKGGSALFFASIFDQIGEGKVITIDIDDSAQRNITHPRVITITGSSVSDNVISRVRSIVGNQTAMVSLDSDHHWEHVIKEMELFSEFVSLGNYLIVEDTALPGPGPYRAVRKFLDFRKDFVQDTSREKFLLTTCPGGFLKRIR